ncbi:hypothetical protein BRCON_2305 [Candidatus Sumerlaea chitinivorans]|jgi:hypothetical protein|uniref:Uncharacterized protein n=1 Tax=Sumerlaea chitinivorans TaxID=2250252 RepID=A0A2Z4Y8T0_SUMC1|nr:hypothetical protein BRCON_2305 [Candidatus Sumerlaea chitinivorans]
MMRNPKERVGQHIQWWKAAIVGALTIFLLVAIGQGQGVGMVRVANPGLWALLRAQLVDGEAINRGEKAPTQALLEDVLLWAYEGLDEPPGYWARVLASGKLPAEEERRALAQRALSPDTTGSLEWARGVVKKAEFLYTPEESVAGAIVYVRGTPEEQKEVKQKALALRTRRIIGVYKDVLLGKPIGCEVPEVVRQLLPQELQSTKLAPDLLAKIRGYLDAETTTARWHVFFHHWSGYRYVPYDPDSPAPPYLPLLVLYCQESGDLDPLLRLWRIQDQEGRPLAFVEPKEDFSFARTVEMRRIPIRAAVLELLADIIPPHDSDHNLVTNSDAASSTSDNAWFQQSATVRVLAELAADLKKESGRDLKISQELRLASIDAFYRGYGQLFREIGFYEPYDILRVPGPFWPEYSYLVWNCASSHFKAKQKDAKLVPAMSQVFGYHEVLTYRLQKKGWLPWDDEGTTGTR